MSKKSNRGAKKGTNSNTSQDKGKDTKPKSEKKTIEYGAAYIAEQLGIESRVVRMKLRAMGKSASGGRYDFTKDEADKIVSGIEAKAEAAKAKKAKAAEKEKKKGKIIPED